MIDEGRTCGRGPCNPVTRRIIICPGCTGFAEVISAPLLSVIAPMTTCASSDRVLAKPHKAADDRLVENKQSYPTSKSSGPVVAVGLIKKRPGRPKFSQR